MQKGQIHTVAIDEVRKVDVDTQKYVSSKLEKKIKKTSEPEYSENLIYCHNSLDKI